MNCSFVPALLILLFSISVSVEGVAQNIKLRHFQTDIDLYREQALQEKVFVHTDRSAYLAGETMWFKVYVVEGTHHTPLDLSKVVYLEVLSKENEPVLQTKIAMEEGSGNGSFYMPLSLKSGNYKLRAYTNWMKNFSPEFYFEKQLTLLNTFLNPELAPQDTVATPDVQFFPEGGDLVSGIRSKVGFKAVGNDGKGLDIEGVVVSSLGDTVAQLDPLKFGMGHFYLTPEDNSSYRALVRTAMDSAVYSFSLPAALEDGFVMQLKGSAEEQLDISIETSYPDQAVYLLVHARQELKVIETQRTMAGKALFTLEKGEMGDGISHITLFNEEMKPVAERLSFKDMQEVLVINAETDQKQYTSRQKVNVQLSTLDGKEKPLAANLSMAVYRLDSFNLADDFSIMEYLWLTSDLSGTIESPSYYFKNKGAEVKAAMDNLLLTQGWRRFQWQDVLRRNKLDFSFVPEYEGHIIQGVVTDKNSGTPVSGAVSYLSVPGKLVQFYASKSNERGELQFITENLYGINELVIQGPSEDKQYGYRFSSPYSAAFSNRALSPFRLQEGNKEQLRSDHIRMQAQNIYWKKEKNTLLAPELDSVAFFGLPDKTYFLDDYSRFPTMEEVMREYVYEVRVRKQDGKFLYKVFNPARELFFQGAPLVLLDGVAVADVDKILEYNPLKVEKLEVLTERFFSGSGIYFDGIVSYTTYKGEMEGFPLHPDLVTLEYDGLQLKREFYSPKYETEQQLSSRMPDFRNLLHWEPEVKSTGQDPTQLSFYTSDLKGTFLLVVQGISPEGKAGVKTMVFEVGEESL